jgi:Kelch motif
VSSGQELYLIGGYRGSTLVPVTTVRRLDPVAGRWVRGPDLPVSLGAGAAAWDGRRVVFAGGVGGDGRPSAAVYALENGSWRRIGTLPAAREHLAAASDGNGTTFFLAGEVNGPGGKVVLAEVDAVTGGTVRRLADVPRPRGSVAGFWSPAAGACVAGGRDGSGKLFSEVDCVDAKGAATRLPSLPTPRHGLGIAVVDGTAYAVLGAAPQNVRITEALQLQP